MPSRVYKPKGYRTRRRGYNMSALRSRVMARRMRYVKRRRSVRKYRYPKINRPLGGFPPKKNVVLRYCESVNLNPGDGTSAVNVFCVNNLYDPNYTGSGHQPMFYDNYATLYSKYKVNYATITMIPLNNKVINTTVGNQVDGTTVSQTQVYASNERAVRMFILVDESPSDYPNDLDNLIEEGNKRMRWRYAPQNTSPNMQKLSFRAYPHKCMNLSYRDANLGATFGGTPGRPLYFICGVDSLDAMNADQMRYQFIITYNVTLYDFIGNQTQN